MPIVVPTLGLLVALLLGAPARQSAAIDEPFPASTALAEGVSPQALAGLSRLVQTFVDDEEIVGAELLVIKSGRTVLHEAFGWRDREAEQPMETGSVFCVRSMTKPVIGAAILMLVDDDQLELDDHVAQYLPAFDVEGSRDITVEHLLTHTSGLPMSLLTGRDPRELNGIGAVAELGAGCPLEFEPGSAFSYSDQGTDTLTALIEVVSGTPAAEFVRTRVLAPLDMENSACVLTEDHALRARALPKYAGSRGAWTRFWSPDEPPLFPIFLGSQGLYATLPDYARFMDFWLHKGRAGSERLLGSRYVRRALTPGPHPMNGVTGFPGLTSEYGFLMQLWTGSGAEDQDDGSELRAFGHGGSDGTHAWVFPEQKGMVLYFTQSRNNTTGLRVEEAIGELFFGLPYDPSQAAPPLEEYLGYYREGEGDRYRAVVRDGEDLALEIMGIAVIPLTYVGEDRWKMRPRPDVVLAFERSESGEVVSCLFDGQQESRFEPSTELPSVDALAARIAQTHQIHRIVSLGPLRTEGLLTIEKLNVSGTFTSWLAWPDRFRYDSVAAGNFERFAFDGERAWYASTTKPTAVLEGQVAELLRRDNLFAHFGDWRHWFPRLQVIQRIEAGDDEVLLVRAGDTSAPAPTLYVDARTGTVGRVDSMTHVETLGRIGQRATFGDFRDVSGMLLPFRTQIKLPHPLLGTIVVTLTVSDIALGVELPEGLFELRE